LRPAWERLRGSAGLKGSFLYVLALLVIAGMALLPEPDDSPLAGADRIAFDAQMRWLRELRPRPIAQDIVLIGIDEQTEREFPEPVALWHPHFAALFHKLAQAHPRAVGVDVLLPERSYESIVPGSDITMMRGLAALSRATALVYAQGTTSLGELVPVQPNYRAILRDENFGVDQQLLDVDNVSRRFREERYVDGTSRPTFAGQILRRLGRNVESGYIDYSLGTSVAHHPFHEVVKWDEERMRAAFAGRIVLIGSLVPTVDRWQLPVRLLAPSRDTSRRERIDHTQPGVLTHLQVLRSPLGTGLLAPVSDATRWLLCALAALVVFSAARPGFIVVGALVVPAALVALGVWSIVEWQLLLPVGAIVSAFWIGLITRGVFDAIEAAVERMRLQSSFAGQVSPAVMREMLEGGLTHGVHAQLAEICVLFSDVRDFTTLSENMPPHIVTRFLQRYFDRMVAAVHRYDGTVDKFIGDGMMVLFGAPRRLEDPCGQAVKCALAMMSELDALNVEFQREGLPTLVIGIGINYGPVTVGNIGSSERHNYSAIGDAVNVAARVEGLTKELARKIIITESVVSRIADRFHFEPLGSHKVKGHSPVNVWGIRTTRHASLQQGVEP
jgi:class 3 adenylate cyclase/CHASE2 domain-containing sensor protein